MSWAGVIIGGATLVTGITSSIMSANAEEDQLAAQGNATAMQMRFLRETRQDIYDAVQNGLLDLQAGFSQAINELEPLRNLDELNEARKLLEDPSAIMDRPATKFQYGQGLDALEATQSRTSGGGTSGRAMVAATEYGQNFASQALDAELNRLAPFINIGVGARTNIANMKQGWGATAANLRVSGATGSGNVTGQMTPAIATTIQQGGQIQATNSINQANIASNVLSQLGLLGANMADRGLFSSPKPTKYPDMYGSPY